MSNSQHSLLQRTKDQLNQLQKTNEALYEQVETQLNSIEELTCVNEKLETENKKLKLVGKKILDSRSTKMC